MRTHETDQLRKPQTLAELFTSPWEELLELVKGNLFPLLDGRGLAVESTHQRHKGRRNGEYLEFDLVAVCQRDVVVVEVRPTLRSEDVTEFLSRLPRFTDLAHEYQGRRILGAVAYLKSDSAVTTYAESQGLFLIRATGSNVSILNAADFEPTSFT